jgi:hypothetical protein
MGAVLSLAMAASRSWLCVGGGARLVSGGGSVRAIKHKISGGSRSEVKTLVRLVGCLGRGACVGLPAFV